MRVVERKAVSMKRADVKRTNYQTGFRPALLTHSLEFLFAKKKFKLCGNFIPVSI
jgi:hypothetical protein